MVVTEHLGPMSVDDLEDAIDDASLTALSGRAEGAEDGVDHRERIAAGRRVGGDDEVGVGDDDDALAEQALGGEHAAGWNSHHCRPYCGFVAAGTRVSSIHDVDDQLRPSHCPPRR